MTSNEEVIFAVEQVLFDTGEQTSVIALGEVGREYADEVTASLVEIAGEEVRFVVVLLSGLKYSLPGLSSYGAGNGGVIEDNRDGGSGEAQLLREELQRDFLAELGGHVSQLSTKSLNRFRKAIDKQIQIRLNSQPIY
jgi:hypothetical protein